MNPSIQKIQTWLNARNQRERLLLLMVGLLIISLIWYALLETPVDNSRASLKQQIANTHQQIRTLTQQQQAIIADALQPANVALAAQDNALRAELRTLDKQLSFYLQQIITPAQMADAIKSALNEAKNLSLTRLENTLPPPPPPPNNNSKNNMAANETNNNSALFKHTLVFEFHGDYFSTLQYLQRMEKLQWRFFWDDLTYKVINYPEADVTITVHTLSNQESLLNV